MKGVSKVFWLSREIGLYFDFQAEENGEMITSCYPLTFKTLFGKLFLRLGQKKPFRLITEERYQELMKRDNSEIPNNLKGGSEADDDQ